jgi:hypothetical protein
MNPWFEEKAPQIDPASVRVFGILVTSRYSKACELVELLRFAEESAKANVNILVEEAFYDSKSTLCSFKLRESVHDSPAEADAIFAAAMKTISQFEWDGAVFHGGDHPPDEEWLR